MGYEEAVGGSIREVLYEGHSGRKQSVGETAASGTTEGIATASYLVRCISSS